MIFDCRKRAAADADQRGKLRLRDIHPLAQGGQVVGHVADQRCSLPFIHWVSSGFSFSYFTVYYFIEHFSSLSVLFSDNLQLFDNLFRKTFPNGLDK